MKVRHGLVLVLVVMMVSVTGCGKKEGDTTTPDGGVTPGNQTGGGAGGNADNERNTLPATDPASCNQFWESAVKAKPVGHRVKSETIKEKKVNGSNVVVGKYTTEEVIEASSVESITTKTTTVTTIPNSDTDTHTSSLTREAFLEFCGKGFTMPEFSGFTFAILEQGQKSVTVKAGTFNCFYRKGKLTSTEPNPFFPEMTMEQWVYDLTGAQLMVKSVVTTTGPNATTTTTQLVDY